MADGQRCHVTNAVNLHAKLLSFSWNHEFKVLNGGPFPAILGIDFLERTQMSVDAASKTFSFGFASDKIGHFSRCDGRRQSSVSPRFVGGNLRYVRSEERVAGRHQCPGHHCRIFPLFSSTLGIARVAPYEIELSDMTPVCSPPYRCAPPKLEIYRGIVNELLEQGVVRPSKSP